MVSVQILLSSWGAVSGNLALTIIFFCNYLFIHLIQFILLKNSLTQRKFGSMKINPTYFESFYFL